VKLITATWSNDQEVKKRRTRYTVVRTCAESNNMIITGRWISDPIGLDLEGTYEHHRSRYTRTKKKKKTVLCVSKFTKNNIT